MTAVVGILNKKAVAIAADSAVTLHNGKIFNKANKIFTLSRRCPVGIMLHNLDSFMGTPWEIIIKTYRQQLRDNSFNKLSDYQEDFLSFLRREHFFSDLEYQLTQLNYFFIGINSVLIKATNDDLKIDEPDRQVNFIQKIKEHTQVRIDFFSKGREVLLDFVGYTYEDFEKIIDGKVEEAFELSFPKDEYPINDEIKTLLKRAYYEQLISKEFSTRNYTGLVFVGFGEKEIFPSLISLNVYLGVGNRLRYFVNEGKGAVISHNNSSDICTFAQSDVMFTILQGIAPDLQETYSLNFKDFLDNYDEVLLNNYTNDKGDLKFLLDRIDKEKLAKYFNNIMSEVIQKKYVQPLYEAVAGLSKEDLGEMAESLIYLTYLQRRITNAEESVGGPVDVAILSKGDGFIWIKRKHYFDPDINTNFLKNYFK